MKVIKAKAKDEYLFNISLNEDNKFVRFYFGGNGDLYWLFSAKIDDILYHQLDDEKIEMSDDNYFIITKENYAVYSLFEQLFLDIKIYL